MMGEITPEAFRGVDRYKECVLLNLAVLLKPCNTTHCPLTIKLGFYYTARRDNREFTHIRPN